MHGSCVSGVFNLFILISETAVGRRCRACAGRQGCGSHFPTHLFAPVVPRTLRGGFPTPGIYKIAVSAVTLQCFSGDTINFCVPCFLFVCFLVVVLVGFCSWFCIHPTHGQGVASEAMKGFAPCGEGGVWSLARKNSSVAIIKFYSSTCKMRPIMYPSLKAVLTI